MRGPIAKRYARAIFALSVERGAFEETAQNLALLAQALDQAGREIMAESATLDPKARHRLALRLAEELGATPLVASFLALLGEKNRLGFLSAIQREYEKLADRALGQLRARVSSATPLSAESLDRIRELFERKTRKKILTEVQIDPGLLGGVVVEVQGRVYDGSLRAQLERLRAAFSG